MTNFFHRLVEATQPAQQVMLDAPIFAACQRGEITREHYVAFLTQAYHHVKHTVPLLMACGSRLPHEYEWLRQAIGHYIEEEMGHHDWILDDIRACDYSADDVEQNVGAGKACQSIELMVAYLYHQIDRGNPMALFGMVWVLEGTSVGVGGRIAQLVKSSLGLPDTALSYLLSHSELDQEHIKFFEALMAKVDKPHDQQAIIESANIVFRLYGDMLQGLTEPRV